MIPTEAIKKRISGAKTTPLLPILPEPIDFARVIMVRTAIIHHILKSTRKNAADYSKWFCGMSNNLLIDTGRQQKFTSFKSFDAGTMHDAKIIKSQLMEMGIRSLIDVGSMYKGCRFVYILKSSSKRSGSFNPGT